MLIKNAKYFHGQKTMLIPLIKLTFVVAYVVYGYLTVSS